MSERERTEETEEQPREETYILCSLCCLLLEFFRQSSNMSPWWKISRKQSQPVPFEVACACGHSLRGQRQPTHQVIPCSACGRSVFIFPLSPLPAPKATEDRGSNIEDRGKDGRLTHAARLGPWRIPLLAGAGTFALVAVIFALIFHFSKNRNSLPAGDPESMSEHFAAGKKLFAHGQFHEAIRELDEALVLHQKHPDSLSSVDRKRLVQMHREVGLFLDLLSESVEEILLQAAAEHDDREWQAVFTDRYRGKSLIFLAGIHRDSSNRWALDYEVFVGDKRARIDWENLQLLRSLPLNESHRLLVGVRLATVEPEAGRTWVVRLQPDSGVLLTDGDALATVYSRPPEGIDEVLKRQAAWVAEMP